MSKIEDARDLIESASRIAVLTGAGISTDSGIPDFRGPNGVWTLDPDAERLSDIRYYRSDPEVRRKSWDRYTANWGSYEPNAGHLAITRLYDQGKLLNVTTQNIDGLHQAAGVPGDFVSELHGNRSEVACLGCGAVTQAYQHRYSFGYDMGCCCGGVLKPNVVFFGENLDPKVWTRAMNAATTCDVYLVVGTSLQVFPAADLPTTARAYGAKAIYVNGVSAPPRVDVRCLGSISEILTDIVPL